MLSWDGVSPLEIHVWDHDNLTEDDPIGHVTVELKALSLESGVVRPLDLTLLDVKHGSLQLEVTLQELGH